MSWSSRRNGIPRISRNEHPAPPLRDLTDREYEQMVDDEQERAFAALHEPHDDDRLGRCPVCRAVPNVRCCEFGRDAA